MIDDVSALIHATRTSLNTIVLSAIDRSDPMAMEQIHLAVKNLDFVCSRLDAHHARVRFTLDENQKTGAAVAELLSAHGVADHDLSELCRIARAELNQADSSVQTLRATNSELTACLRVVIREHRERDHGLAIEIGDVVVAHSEALIRSERAWFAPFGFEPGADALPSLEEFYEHAGADAELQS